MFVDIVGLLIAVEWKMCRIRVGLMSGLPPPPSNPSGGFQQKTEQQQPLGAPPGTNPPYPYGGNPGMGPSGPRPGAGPMPSMPPGGPRPPGSGGPLAQPGGPQFRPPGGPGFAPPGQAPFGGMQSRPGMAPGGMPPGARPPAGPSPQQGAGMIRPGGASPTTAQPPQFGSGGPAFRPPGQMSPSNPPVAGGMPFQRPPGAGPQAGSPNGPTPGFTNPGAPPPRGPDGNPGMTNPAFPAGFRPGPGGGPGGPAPPGPETSQTSPPAPGGAASRARRAYVPMDSYAAGGTPDYGAGGMPPQPGGQMPMMPAPGMPAGGMPPMMPQGPAGGQFVPQAGVNSMPPAAANQFIQPAKPPSFGAPQAAAAGVPGPGPMQGMPPHGMPQQGMQGMPQQGMQQQSAIGQLSGHFQNMNMGGAQNQPMGAVQAVNVMQRPPEVNEFDDPEPTSWMSPQLSISQSATSNCNPAYKRCTINSIPQTPSMLTKSRLPFGLLITPYRHLLPGEEAVPVINPPQIVRCRRFPNFFDWDTETRSHVDRMKRAELTHSVVEYVAPQEYMVRPPQPVVMLFVIDVSLQSVQSGMIAVACKAILASLDGIPNTDNRTKIGIITVDSTLHFYNLSSTLSEPQMLVVADLEDVFLPLPYDLLVPLTESRPVIERLLNQLPDMFAQTQVTYNVLGRALQAAHKMISAIGGKIIVLQSSLPNISEGCLKSREDPKLLGTPKEVTLLQPSIAFYKNLAVDCSRSQVSIDVFFFNSHYADVATLSGCAKFTGGSVFYYPNFTSARQEDVVKVSKELQHFLSRPIGLEAVLRVRASKGIKMTAFHGNFFLRSTDLLALPNVSPDNSYAIEMQLQDVLTSNVACFQTALLHTSSNGERRIRVLTLAVPITTNMADVFASADQYAIAALLAKKGIERSLISKIEDARDAITYKLNEIIAAYRTAFSSSGQAAQLILPKNLKLLPVLILGLLKTTAFRATNLIPSDLRSFAMAMMYVYPTELCILAMHPRFYALHLMDQKVGLPDENDKIVMPPLLNLSSEKLERNGIYLLDNSTEIFVWIGRSVAPELCQMIFDKPNYEAVPVGKVLLPSLKNEWNQRVQNIIGRIKHYRLLTMTTFPHIYIVKEDGEPNLRMWFLTHLVEDRIESGHSYPQFLQVLRENSSKLNIS
ncbi:COPII subunit [Dinochytrium kinnereticum]|nr:COPII subunit [Dinochytrium kinnereticum]